MSDHQTLLFCLLFAISAILIIKIAQYVIASLTHVINECLSEGNFSTELKTSVVTPMPKTGDSSDIIHYRPLAVLATSN